MSDILIKGMEMPIRCGRCDMCITEADGDIDFHKACCITGAVIENLGEKMEDCPLIPVPPHGRLIDAHAVQDEWYRLNFDRKISDETLAYWNYQLSNAPTIIPAEEEKNNNVE